MKAVYALNFPLPTGERVAGEASRVRGGKKSGILTISRSPVIPSVKRRIS